MKKEKKEKTISLTLNVNDVGMLSEMSETIARVGMDQFDAILSWTRDSLREPVMGYQPCNIITNRVADFIARDYSPEHKDEISLYWDMYQVLRHRLSWDRAEKEGLTDVNGGRNWKTMMGVNYDDPMRRSVEPLILIEGTKDDHYRITLTPAQLKAMVYGLEVCKGMSNGDLTKGLEVFARAQGKKNLPDGMAEAINECVEGFRHVPTGESLDEQMTQRIETLKMQLLKAKEATNERIHTAGHEPT